MKGNGLYKSVSLLRVGNLAKIQQRGALPFALPGRKGRLVAKARSVKSVSETEYTWVGDLQKEEGTVMLIAKEGRVFGHITVGGDAYELHDLGNGINVLAHIDDAKFTKEECVASPAASPKSPQPEKGAGEKTTNHGGDVRVLVLFTANASNAVPNINDMATLSVLQTNTAFANSGITNARIVLAGVRLLDFNETMDMQADVRSLAANGAAQNLRNMHEADIVVLLTDGNYGTNFGVAFVGPREPLAYAIVEANAAAARYTFAHETGHLFGALHDVASSAFFARGYEFKTGIWPFKVDRRTLLVVMDEGKERILQYSNPNVEYKNKATGTDINNNARQIMEQATTLAAFRSFTPPLSVSISGPAFGNNSGTYTWASTVSNGFAPFRYLWEYSLDGFVYSEFGSSPSVTAPMPYDSDLYLRLTVEDANRNQAVAFHYTSNANGGGCVKCEPAVAAGETAAESATETSILPEKMPALVYPNPSSGETDVIYETDGTNAKTVFALYNLMGGLVYSKETVKAEQGVFIEKIDLSGLNSGQYILKIQSGANVETKKLTLSK